MGLGVWLGGVGVRAKVCVCFDGVGGGVGCVGLAWGE